MKRSSARADDEAEQKSQRCGKRRMGRDSLTKRRLSTSRRADDTDLRTVVRQRERDGTTKQTAAQLTFSPALTWKVNLFKTSSLSGLYLTEKPSN